ncbi:MAG: hypothetical protein WCP87_00805 [Atribacterota bacterium]
MTKKILVVLLVVTLVSLAVPAFAQGRKMNESRGPFGFRIHQETYMTLLSEKYAPELVSDWKAEFAKRDTILKDMKALRGDDSFLENATKRLDDLKEKLAAIETKIKNGEMNREEVRKEIQKFFGPQREKFQQMRNHFRNEWQDEIGKVPGLYQKLTNALESGDATQIKEALSKLLEEYKNVNSKLETKLNEMKQAPGKQ